MVKKEDIPKLLNLGKENIYVWEMNEKKLHENEAAQRIASALAGEGISLTEPVEGKVELKAEKKGLLKINTTALEDVMTSVR